MVSLWWQQRSEVMRKLSKAEDYGLLVDLDDQKQLKNTIIHALETKWGYGKIIEYAFQNTWERVAQKVLH